MYSKCSGYMPQFRKMETSYPVMPDVIAPNSPINPVVPVPTAPAIPAPTNDGTGGNGSMGSSGLTQPPAVSPVGPPAPSNPMMPEVIPNAPLFTVPSNPLLPPEYQEVLSYESLQYMNGFLRTQIGRTCDVQFLIGSSTTEIRTGVLIGVGINYILLQDVRSKEVMACDYYSIKFVNFHY